MATNNNELKLATGATVANQTVNGNVVGLDVNTYSSWNINQTTAGIDLTLNNPTRPTVDVGLLQFITNVGTVPFTMYGAQVNPNQTVMVKYAGTVWTAIIAPPATNSPITDWALLGNAGTNPATNYIGTSDAQNLSIRTNGVERLVVDTAGRVGAGVATPVNRFDVYQPSTDASFSYAATSDGASIPFFSFLGNATATKNTVLARASRGTTALPTGTLLNDYTRLLTYSNHNGTGFSTAAHFGVAHTENSAAASNGNQFNFFATPIGAAAAVRSATLLGGGFLGLGASTPHSGITNPASFATGFLNSNAAALTLDGSHSNVVLTLAGAQTVTLPATTGIITRVYTIANPTTTIKTISNYTDITGTVSTVIPANSSLTIQADSTVWRQINGGGATAPTMQVLNATGNVTAWNSTVEVGATPLTANITITLPTVVSNAGKNITFIRRDNTAFTVTIAAAGGQTLTLLNNGSELSQQNGALTVQAIDATNARQTSNIGIAPSLAEFGEVVLGADITTQAANTAFDVISFTLPSAGTWEVNVMANTRGTLVHTASFFLTDSANAVLTGTGVRGQYPVSSIAFPISITHRITTTGAATYKFRAMANVLNALAILQNTATPQVVTGSTKVTYKKIGGLTPTTGQLVEFSSVYATSPQLSASIVLGSALVPPSPTVYGNLPYNSATGVFTLSPNKTYKLRGASGQSTGSNGAILQWRDITNNILLGTGAYDALNNGQSNDSVATITTGATPVTVRLEYRYVTAVGNAGVSDGNGSRLPYMEVEQLGSSAVSTIPVNDQTGATTSGYFDIGNMRIQWGRASTANVTTVTMPAAFADTNYNLTGNALISATSVGTIQATSFAVGTTTQFTFTHTFINVAGAAPATNNGQIISWQAIGRKP